MPAERPRLIQITVAGPNRRRVPGLEIRRSSVLAELDFDRQFGLPVTSPALTLLDLAADGVTPAQLTKCLEHALTRRLCSEESLRELLRRAAGRPGSKVLQQLIGSDAADLDSESRAEAELISLLRDTLLARPQQQAKVLGHRVDLLWPDLRLIVEVDGRRFHSSRAKFESDRQRDGELQTAGYMVIRVPAAEVERHPRSALARVAEAIGAARRASSR